jgi:GT2 family glycosyltransferase
LPEIVVTVAIPTLAADEKLAECLEALGRQTRRDFEVVVVDNSGRGAVRLLGIGNTYKVIENKQNVGFGRAINQVFRESRAAYLATLNDDAVAHPGWLAALVEAMERRPDAGMCASQVRLAGGSALDSAGMVVASDGSSKQRGHGLPPGKFASEEEVLLPSGSAAIYRRVMLDQIGLFDEEYFLYCEDTDLGLRARWAGWKCLYAPSAVVEHHYSHSTGRASPLKAYLVERNRLFTVARNFPARLLWRVPLASAARYFWHAWFLMRGRGLAARFHAEGGGAWRMPWYVLRAHLALCAAWPRLMRERRRIRASARLSAAEFAGLLRAHSLSVREVAAL